MPKDEVDALHWMLVHHRDLLAELKSLHRAHLDAKAKLAVIEERSSASLTLGNCPYAWAVY
ncbi:MAG: hypothetical protein AAGO57_06155 [Pseudomonadota bacterium]